MVAPVFESVYKTEKFLSCFFSDLWTIFIDIVNVISHFHFLQIRVQAINTLTFIFDLLIFEGNHLENKKYRFFLRKCLSTSLKMKPFSKLTSHRLCQQPKCPQTSAGLAQSVDRLHCGRSLVWAPGPDLYSGSLKNKSEGKVLLLFCGLASLTRRQNSALNKQFGAKYIDTQRAFFKSDSPTFPSLSSSPQGGDGGKLSSSHASFYPCLCNPVYILYALRGLNLRYKKYNQLTKVKNYRAGSLCGAINSAVGNKFPL